MNTRKIVIFNQDSGYLTVDVANTYFNNGWDVTLVYGKIRVSDRNLNSEIKTVRTIPYWRSSLLLRLVSWLLCYFHVALLILFRFRKNKFIFYSNPPFSYFASALSKNPFLIIIFDLYPDFLKSMGVKKENFIYRLWAKANKKYFDRALGIITLSNGMKSQIGEYLTVKNQGKIIVVPLWTASRNFRRVEQLNNPFIKQNNLLGKFIILYSGNMGIGHSLEILIDVAKQLRDYEDILFLFIGEGAKKNKLMDLAVESQLENVKFLGWQDPKILKYSLASGKISVVSLDSTVTELSIPSKTFNYLAVGSPILGIGKKDSELSNFITNNKVGWFFDDSDIEEICDTILEVFNNPTLQSEVSANAENTSKEYDYEIAKEYLLFK